MNLNEIRSVLDDERRTDTPQPLPDDFYADVASYLAELRNERVEEAAAADDPWNADSVNRLTHRIGTAEDAVESLCNRRIGKLLNQASLAANGSGADPSGLTSEERAFFETVVTAIENHHEAVLGPVRASSDSGAGAMGDVPPEPADGDLGTGAEPAESETSGGAAAADGSSDPDRPVPPDVSAAGGSATGEDSNAATAGTPDGGSDPETASSDAPADPTNGADVDGATATAADRADRTADDGGGEAADAEEFERVRVRITRDVGEILGVDEREYHLEADDVLTLPAANADPLVDRGAAERIS